MIDSGAARSVCPVNTCSQYSVSQSHDGPTHFRTATGDRVTNQGLRQLEGVSDEGTALSLKYYVAEVSTPLDSVSQICDKGNIVVFTKNGGYICGPRGRMAFKRQNDTYVRNTWVKRNPSGRRVGSSPMEVGALQGFPRQE